MQKPSRLLLVLQNYENQAELSYRSWAEEKAASQAIPSIRIGYYGTLLKDIVLAVVDIAYLLILKIVGLLPLVHTTEGQTHMGVDQAWEQTGIFQLRQVIHKVGGRQVNRRPVWRRQ